MQSYTGKSVYPGIAFGDVYVLKKSQLIIDESPAEDIHSELKRFNEAKRLAYSELEILFQKTSNEIGEKEAGIINVQRMMLEDDDLIDMIKTCIKKEYCRAAYAVLKAGRHFSQAFAALDDQYMKARAPDFLDITHRMVRILTGIREEIKLNEPSIIIADDLTPSETVHLDKSMARAFIIRLGSANSHTAILARTLRIPTLIQVNIPLDTELNGCPAAVDSHNEKVYIKPNNNVIRKLKSLHNDDIKKETELEKLRGLSSVTMDGLKVNLFANIGSVEDMEAALANDAEGIGLFRSEFLFLSRDDYPSEEEQFEAYRKVAQGMKGRPVIIRTFDIGADKTIPYFSLASETNPAMGLRAVRIYFEKPEIFKTQLRAIYRASAFGNISIMFPMIATLQELRRCKEIAFQVRIELSGAGIAIGNVPVGIMIETPAAALIADDLAKEADFFSAGTNDLTQYTLAVDRQNEKLESFFDPHHPAVLKLLKMTAKSAAKAGISAGICGELASDVTLTEKLLQMGFTEFSVSPGFILRTRKKIRSIKPGTNK